MKRKKGYFSISAVAEMFSVHQQTIRLYEKEGLINPKRSEGNTRLFSEEDIERLEEVIHLTHQLGINLAGVEMILKLQKKIDRLQKDMNKVFENAQQELAQEEMSSKKMAKEAAQRLVNLKQHAQSAIPFFEDEKINASLKREKSNKKANEDLSRVDWEVNYDE